MYFDSGLAIIDIGYTKEVDDLNKMKKNLHKALDAVLARYNIKLISKGR